MVAARPAGLRPGAEQHVLQRPARRRPAASTPSRGTSWSRSPPGGSSAPGSTCDRASTSARSSPSSSVRSTAVFVPARGGQRLPDPGGRHRLLLPGQRPLEPGGRRTPTPSSTWPTRPLAIDWPIPLDEAELSDADRAHPRLAEVTPMPPPAGPDHRRRTGSWAGRWRAALPDAIAVGRDELDLADPRRWPGSTGAPYERGHQRRRLHRGRRGRDARGRAATPGRSTSPASPRLVGRRPRAPASPWCTSPPTTSSTARREIHAEDEPFSPAGRVRPDQGRRRRAGRHRCRGTTSCAPAG